MIDDIDPEIDGLLDALLEADTLEETEADTLEETKLDPLIEL